MAMGVFEEGKVEVQPAMGMAVEPNPKRPFLLKFKLLKVVVLIAAKITWFGPKIMVTQHHIELWMNL
jgi:hypothetical protein